RRAWSRACFAAWRRNPSSLPRRWRSRSWPSAPLDPPVTSATSRGSPRTCGRGSRAPTWSAADVLRRSSGQTLGAQHLERARRGLPGCPPRVDRGRACIELAPERLPLVLRGEVDGEVGVGGVTGAG